MDGYRSGCALYIGVGAACLAVLAYGAKFIIIVLGGDQ